MDTSGKHLAFIVGHYKSGSTWLDNLLCLHPAIRGLRETHLFRYTSTGQDLESVTDTLFTKVAWSGGGRREWPRHRLASLLRVLRGPGQARLKWSERPTTLLDLSLRNQRKLRRRLLRSSDPDDYRVLFYSFLFDALAPDRYLLEKTSTNIFQVPEIRRLFPRAKLLAIFRDGRDVVVSDRFHLLNRYGKEQVFADSVKNWRRAIEAQMEHAEPCEVLTLSYEGLSKDTEQTTERILQFLEIESDRSLVEEMVRKSSFEFVTGRKRGSENKKAFYRKGVVGDWRSHFSEQNRREFGELAGDLLVRLGYEEDPDWASWS